MDGARSNQMAMPPGMPRAGHRSIAQPSTAAQQRSAAHLASVTMRRWVLVGNTCWRL